MLPARVPATTIPDRHRSFVGRTRERQHLAAALEQARGARGAVFLLAGEPGIGKTRLASEMADEAEAKGIRVCWGRCWEGTGTPGLWPWVQILRALAAAASDADLRTWLGRGGPDLADLLPELRQRFPELPASPPLEADQARFRLLDSATSFLARAAAALPPLLLILDDLHWADELSLYLAQFLARSAGRNRFLLLGTYRRVEARQAPTLGRILESMARDATVLSLSGLRLSEVRQYLRDTLATPPTAALVSAVHTRTEGNPLFVVEIARILQPSSPGRWDRFEPPPEVFAAIGRRLESLSAQTRQCLRLAAVIGREFDVELLAAMVGTGDRAEVAACLEEAVAADVVSHLHGDRFRFAHELVREALYRTISAPERRELHGRIARQLESSGRSDSDAYLAALAYHCCAAVADGSRDERAIGQAVRAAQHAASRHMPEEAVRYYDRALAVLGDGREVEARRIELLMAHGHAHWAAGHPESARDTFADVADRLRPHLCDGASRNAAGHFAEAVLGFGGAGLGFTAGAMGVTNQRLLRMLDEALAAVGDGDSPMRALLLGRRALAMSLSGDSEQRIVTSTESVAVARRCGDRSTLITTLLESHWGGWCPQNVHERLGHTAELIELASAAGDPQIALAARSFRLPDLLEIGDIAAATREMVAHASLAEELRHPFHLYCAIRARAVMAMMHGRFDEAEALLQQTLEAGERVDEWLSYNTFVAQSTLLALLRGRLTEAEALLEDVVKHHPDLPDWRAPLALVQWRLGRHEAARQHFEFVVAGDFALLTRGFPWLFVAAVLAELCVALRDTTRAAALWDRLQSHAGKMVVLGAVGLYGTADRFLAVLAEALGRRDAAREHFEQALVLEAKVGSRPTLALTQYAYAAFLADGSDAERRRSRELLDAARAGAEEMGMEGVAPDAREAGGRVEGGEVGPSLALPSNAFRRTATGWTVVFGGNAAEVKDRKGMRYIAELLREPERDCHVADLVALGSPAPNLVERVARSEGVDARAIPDPRARAAYRARLEDLRGELGEAEGNNDVGRASRLRAEIDGLGEELAQSFGWGAHNRAANETVEKMRKAVLGAIRNALRDLDSVHPVAGRHLHSSLVTGVFCVYRPEQAVRWRVETE